MMDALIHPADILNPRRCALLVIDAQNDFINSRGWSARHGADVASLRLVIPTINRLVQRARLIGLPVVYVCMEHGQQIDAPNYRARYAARGMETDVLCAAGTWGAQLDGEIASPAAQDVKVVRHTYDGFAAASLNETLNARGVETIVATGIVTDLCVLATVQRAFTLGYYTAVVEDGTAAETPERHEFALDAVRRYLGLVLPAEAICEHWPTLDAGTEAGAP